MRSSARELEKLELSLQSVALNSCEISRGLGDLGNPGAVLWDQNLDMGSTEAAAQYLVNGHAIFQDADGVSIADVKISYELRFDAAAEANLEQLQAFAPSIIMIVTPYQRELLATLTSRMGMPPFTLPLVFVGDLELSASEEEATADSV